MQNTFRQLMTLPNEVQRLIIADSLDTAIREMFPDKYMGMCHVYAVVGASVLSMAYGRSFIPVAGIALIDTGTGQLLEMLDSAAFMKSSGGAYHCWIESADDAGTELIDFIYRHNAAYAKLQGVGWDDALSRPYLWGLKKNLCLASLPTVFPVNKVWFKASEDGKIWLERHMQEFGAVYADLALTVVHHIQREYVSICPGEGC